MEYLECNIGDTNLRIYENGEIDRFHKLLKKWTKAKINNSGYKTISINKCNYRINRIMGHFFYGLDLEDPILQVDHINRIKEDNHLSNLRVVTPRQNMWNMESKGYRFHQGRYEIAIRTEKGRFYFYRKTEEEAKELYQELKNKYHNFDEI
jgi:hypothetical protein